MDVYDTLEELDLSCRYDKDTRYLDHIDGPASFRSFTALKRLSLPVEVVNSNTIRARRNRTAINEALPSGLVNLYVYNADPRFMYWFEPYFGDQSMCPSNKLALDICGY